jgi:hypothetical protein
MAGRDIRACVQQADKSRHLDAGRGIDQHLQRRTLSADVDSRHESGITPNHW